MELLLQVLVISFFIIWFLVSVIFQFNAKFKSNISKSDLLSIVPSWSFFAPIPGTSDYRIVYRDKGEEFPWTDWKEIEFYKQNTMYRCLWNPSKIEIKALSDICQLFLNEITSEVYLKNPKLIQITTSYLAILSRVVGEKKENQYTERQFAILTATGYNKDRNVVPLYISTSHLL